MKLWSGIKVGGLAVALSAVLALASACSPTATTAPAPAKAPAMTPNNAVVRVVLDEWNIKPDISSVPAGKVSFVVVDEGKHEHEVVVLKTDLAGNALVMRSDWDGVEGSNTDKVNEDASGENFGEVEVEKGETAAGTFNLPPGHYVLLCNIKGHFRHKMFADFTVTK